MHFDLSADLMGQSSGQSVTNKIIFFTIYKHARKVGRNVF